MFLADPTLDLILRGSILTTMGLVWVVLLVRVVGLRSFSKMTNFDFVMTIAVGSLLAGAGQATEWPGFAQSMLAMATLFLVQFLVAKLRKESSSFEGLIQNEPKLLMRDGEFLEQAMRDTRVARDDLVAKLREANVLDLSEVRAVVLETTGDVSVLHGESLEEALLAGVRD